MMFPRDDDDEDIDIDYFDDEDEEDVEWVEIPIEEEPVESPKSVEEVVKGEGDNKYATLVVTDGYIRGERYAVKIHPEVMKALGLSTGDIVEIIGKSRAAAKVIASSKESPFNYVYMNKIVQMNAGVKAGDKVIIRRARVVPAKRVIIAPVRASKLPHRFTPKTIHTKIIGVPVVEGNFLEISSNFKVRVLRTTPSTMSEGVVLITDDTKVKLISRTVSLEKVVTYDDIGGLDDVIQKIRELVELPLKHPEIFKRLGIDPPKGILLYGPPGCGKTLLAKAVATETDAYFISVNGPEIMGKFYGEPEQRLRKIFDEAKRNAPAIIFIDEIDAIAPKRSEVFGEVEKRVVAQLLSLMDGIQERGQVIVMAATNRPDDIDPALRRPGRFDREIEVPVPNRDGRKQILEIHTRNVPLADDVDLDKLADVTHGYTGADLAALVREAAMAAIRRHLPEINKYEDQPVPPEILDKIKVTMADFQEALRSVRPSALREVFIEIPKVRREDIGGLEDVKQQLKESVERPLKYPEVFERMGIEPPKGILLYGPPGCGKTLLAKAVATESGANFIAVRGPEVLSKRVGESERMIREIFRKARMAAPTVIFFDEIDAIAPRRGMHIGDSGVSDRVLSQLLTEMDGIQSLNKVIVIAATNRPDILDPALLRPGRFDRIIYVGPPDKEARKKILEIHTRNVPLAEDVDLEELAERTEYYTGADLEALVREAVMTALRENIKATKVYMRHFEEALRVVPPSLTEEMIKYYEKVQTILRRRGQIGSKIESELPYTT